MLKQRAIAGTFILFASLGTAFVAAVSSGLWENRGGAFLAGGAVAAAGLAVGLLGRRFFFFMKEIEDGPVLLARHADAAAACVALALLVVFMVPVLEFIGKAVALAALLGVDFLALVYAGVCLGVAVEYAGEKMRWVAVAFLAGIAAGAGVGFAVSPLVLPAVMLACAVCGAAASLVFGAGHRRISEKKSGWKTSVVRGVLLVLVCAAGIAVLVMVEPMILRLGEQGKGFVNTSSPAARQIVEYTKSLYAHVVKPLRALFLALVAVGILYVIVVSFLKDSRNFMAWHNAARHKIVSIIVLAVMCALLLIGLALPDFSRQYEALRGYEVTTTLSGGGK